MCEPIRVAAVVVALLLGIHVAPSSVAFAFRGAPATVRAAYTSAPLVSCGSGLPVPLRGVHLVVHFRPARSATAVRRLPGTGPVLGLAKTCDFESDLAWAVGLDRRRPYDVVRSKGRVAVVFRG